MFRYAQNAWRFAVEDQGSNKPTVIRLRIAMAGAVALVAVSAACSARVNGGAGDGRLTFTPHASRESVTPGVSALGLAAERDGFLFVPHDNSAIHPSPLLVLLHGATQRARMFDRLADAADSAGVVLLAPDSRDITWDGIRGDFGPDIAFLSRAIDRAFDRAHIDPCRVAIGGFSDGASYALSLGIRNARLVHGVVAFSPGFIVPADSVQRLPVFVRHGTHDQILPIDGASRTIVRRLRDAGFAVDYEEFDGRHTVRPADARASLHWVTQRGCGQ
jgi:phospholipase/carboxylesterase